MNIRDLQTLTHIWRETRYPGTSLEHRAAVERDGGTPADLRREVADLVIAACGVASGAGFDLSDALRDRLAEITSRT